MVDNKKITTWLLIFFMLMNIYLIYDRFVSKSKYKDKVEIGTGFLVDNLVGSKIDTLLLVSSKNNFASQYNFNKPTIFFFFNHKTCETCVIEVIEYLLSKKDKLEKRMNCIIINTDIKSIIELKNYPKRYDKINLFGMQKISFHNHIIKLLLPSIVITNEQGEIIFSKKVIPNDDYKNSIIELFARII
jgi:hypothetical protein